MRTDLNKREILKVLLLFLALAAILGGLLWPVLVNIGKTTEETRQLRGYLEQKYEQSLLSRITKRKMSEIKNEYPDLAGHIFKKGQELMLITYLENMAAAHELIQTVANSNIDNIKDNRVQISISLSGEYKKILAYLADLESSDYFLNIERLQITPVYSRSGTATNDANLYLTLGLYVNR